MEYVSKIKGGMTKEDSDKLTAKLNRYHIHIYSVVAMTEIDVTAKDDEAALEMALFAATKNKFKQADCNVIAEIQEGEHEQVS